MEQNKISSETCNDLNKRLNTALPSIFFNILHLAIENNSIDVLRICLKYGLNPNEPGIRLKIDAAKTGASKPNDKIGKENDKSNKSLIKFPIKCNYCKNKLLKAINKAPSSSNPTSNAINNNQNFKNNYLLYQTLITNNDNSLTIQEEEEDNKKASPSVQLTPLEEINYSSYSYLVRLPPIFLTVSKCNHAALELLLTYDACSNVQDELGNTPLHLAVAKRNPCYNCVYLLLKYHAISHAFNNKSQSPLSIIKLLVKNDIICKNNETNNVVYRGNSSSRNADQAKSDNSQTWNYSISSIHSSLINDLFKNLDLMTISSAMGSTVGSEKALSKNALSINQLTINTTNKHFQQLNQNQQSPIPEVDSSTNLNTNSNNTTKDIPNSNNSSLSLNHKSRSELYNSLVSPTKKSTNKSLGSLKRKHEMIRNYSAKPLLVSHSLRNLSKIKNASKSNSMSLIGLNSIVSHDSSSNNQTANHINGEVLDKIENMQNKKPDKIGSLFRNHSSSSDATPRNISVLTTFLNRKSSSSAYPNVNVLTNLEPNPKGTRAKSAKAKLRELQKTATITKKLQNQATSFSNKSLITIAIPNNKSKSLVNIKSTTLTPNSGGLPSPNNPAQVLNTPDQEKLLFTKNSKSIQLTSADTIVKQSTLTNKNKVSPALRFNSNATNSLEKALSNNIMSKSTTKKYFLNDYNDSSLQASIENDANANHNNNNDNLSIVSSKISLFKRTVSVFI